MLICGPLVSVGLPVYNAENSIREAINSILTQTYRNIEIIISDNASTDKTGEICQEYVSRDHRIRYYRNIRNIGPTANFRRVLQLSQGEYFMWTCADDIRPSAAIEYCLDRLVTNHRVVMAYGPVLMKVEGGNGPILVSNEMSLSMVHAAERIRVFTDNLVSQCIIFGLFRRKALMNVIFPDSYGQEYLTCLQILLLGPLAYVNTPMLIYRVRKRFISNNPMYSEVSLTLINLLNGSRIIRRKCWTVLTLGCYYLLKSRTVSVCPRVRAALAHFFAFTQVYHRHLAKELVFLSFVPVAYSLSLIWCFASRRTFSFRIASKLRSILSRVE
jgi:glycosyltransferase involved in cell wall biosynthesis